MDRGFKFDALDGVGCAFARLVGFVEVLSLQERQAGRERCGASIVLGMLVGEIKR